MQTLTAKKLRFSDLELDKARRLLLRNYEPIPLNAKAFDLLMVLVEHRGQVLSKDELLDRVWPGQFVEEGNLKVHISALRKALGERKDEHRFIITIPGRGYSFVADVEEIGNGDIVIEKHSLSRISIDESVEEAETPFTDAPAYPLQQRASEARFRWGRLLFALFAVFFVGSAGVAGYLIINRNEDAKAGIIRSQIRRLTTKGNISFAALSPDGKLFAYALKELERNSLWLGFVEGGSDLMVRPSETGRYNDLAFSADGNDILFTFSGADSRESVLYRMPVSGGPREKIRSGVVSFCVSPDGRSYAFGRTNAENRSRELVVGQLDGSEEHVVTSFPIVSSFGSESISWSPDGNAIAVGAKTDDQKRRDEVFIVQVTDGSLRRLTNYGWKEVIKTAWIDDGSGLLLVAQEKDSHTSVSYSQIWHVTFPEGEIRQLTHDLSSYRSVLNASKDGFLSVELRQTNNIWVAPSDDLGQARQVTFGTFGRYDGLWGLDWAADGKIVFTSTDNQSQVISAMNPDGSNLRQLTPPGYDDSMVNTSSDGRYIVFQSTRSGGSNIWRMDSDGGDVVQLTSDGNSYQPFISPDNRYVYFKSFGDNSGLWRVPIDGGQPDRLTDWEVSYFSLSPDGEKIAGAVGSKLAIISADGGLPEKQFDLTRFGTLSGNTRWSPDGKTIAYRDRTYGYWLQPVEGGAPERMKGLPREKFYNFAWSKDGKFFAFIRGQEIRDVVLFQRPR